MSRHKPVYPKYDIHLGKVYDAMIDRCYNPSCSNYKYYGARGVRVCKLWRNNRGSFYEWAFANGWRRGLSIDKDLKGSGKLYSPKTCCFLTKSENSRIPKKDTSNYRKLYFEYKGKRMYLKDICNIVGIDFNLVRLRVLRGSPLERALSASSGGLKRQPKSTLFFEIKGERKSLMEWCTQKGIPYHTAYSRLKRENCNILQILRPLNTKKEDY